ncbi:MAG: hypothetical protein KDA45_07835 [Planctomycetales bacterium]|nr:hypothetical protein [Planctomycetales bacterium]
MADFSETPDDQMADAVAPFMFYLSLLFLALLASIMVLWIDVPRVVETYELERQQASTVLAPRNSLLAEEALVAAAAYRWGQRVGVLLLLLWPIFIGEQLLHLFLKQPGESFQQKHPQWLVFCLFPPLRLCARHRVHQQFIWLPKLGWQVVDRRLQRRLERAFSIPMIWIALLILPVLGLQAIFNEKIVDYPWLRGGLHFSAGLIWFAFAAEFLVMVSVADKKLSYCKKHWLDLMIIILPLVSFLRTLRLVKATRMMQFGKLQQISRLMRVYRLRGVAMRGFRALLLLEVAQRLLRTSPQRRIEKLEEEYREKQRDLEFLRQEIDELRAKHSSPSDEHAPLLPRAATAEGSEQA